jgi:CheY-like chemotaxis protein
VAKETQPLNPDSIREAFRHCLREADKFILEGKFDLAKQQLIEAKKLDSRNPFIIAFEERISLFEKKPEPKKPVPAEEPPPETIEEGIPVEEKPIEGEVSQEALEKTLREQIEGEYRSRFTQELHKAEERAAKILQDERKKFEQQNEVLRKKYEEQISDVRSQAENEFQKKLDEEILKAEDRLDNQHRSELAFLETEMKSQLTQQHEEEMAKVRDRLKKEQQELLERERSTFDEREQILKSQFNEKLLSAVRKTESVVREQGEETKQEQQERFVEELTKEHDQKFAQERDALRAKYDELRTQVDQMQNQKEQQLNEEVDRRLQKQLEGIRKTETEKYEQKRSALRLELEAEYLKKFEKELSEERHRLKSEAGSIAESQKKQLEIEIANAEERLEKQHRAELAATEEQTKSKLHKQYEVEMNKLQKAAEKERDSILDAERKSFEKRESELKEQFNLKLLDGIRKTESVIREQSLKEQKIEREKIIEELTKEHDKRLAKEREQLTKQYDNQRAELEKAHAQRRNELIAEAERHKLEQTELLKKAEEEKLEQKRAALRQELERDFRKTLEEQTEAERRRIQQEAEFTIEAERKKLEEEHAQLMQKQNAKIQKIRADLRNEMDKTLLRRLEKIAHEYDHKMELLGAKIPNTPEGRRGFYKAKMLTRYQSGQPTVEDARVLMQLKELLELTFDEHLAVETDVRLELYAKAVEKRIIAGDINVQNPIELSELKQKFNITAEEAQMLEPYILSCYQRIATKGRIFVVDDDEILLKTLEKILTDGGYQVYSATDIKTSVERLKNTPVDLILSDIKFPVGELDGFKFFSIVQDQLQLKNIPFIFMSSLSDGVIVRSGVQLGVDDYLTKPLDADLLLAVVEGKIKRYRNITRE